MLNTLSPVTLQMLLEAQPHTHAILSGDLRSPLVNFVFAEVEVANTAFKAFVREQKFDLGELALVTFFQAKTYGKPYVLMPAVISARGQHHTIFYNPARGHLAPGDLNGHRVGVRAYTQTTGAWLRGILEKDYGVDVRRVQWITFEDPHVAEFRDPPWVERAPAGKKIQQMLMDGELDAAILGRVAAEGGLAPLIPDAKEAGQEWAKRHGGVPINHMLVVRESLTRTHPDTVREVYRLVQEGARQANVSGDWAPRFGVEAVRKSLETLMDYSERQGLIPRRFEVDELFNDVTLSLA